MNDLRSTSQALNGDDENGREASDQPIPATPPRVRPEAADDRRQARLQLVADGQDERSAGSRHMSQRQSIKARAGRGAGSDGDPIESRPTRRRETEDEPQRPQESFPWSFDFDDEDEPEELQASTPLLSRAFRSGSR